MRTKSRKLMTAKEFMIAYPEENLRKYELIDGVVYKYLSPYTIHQEILGFLSLKLYEPMKKEKTKYFMSLPVDVYLFDEGKEDECNTVVQPDAFVCDKNKIRENGCFGSPDFAVEVIGKATVEIDYDIKLNKYITSGIKEYWIINPNSRRILKYLFTEDKKINSAEIFNFGDKVKISVLDDFEIDFTQFSSEF